MKEKGGDCYVDIWRDANFEGERLRIHGPAEYPHLRFEQDDWGDEIGSLRVGPCALVLAYRDQNFKDKMITLGPNDEVADLRALKFDDDIDSVQVIDSLRIFDRLLGRGDPPPAPPDDNSHPPPRRGKPRGRNRKR
jgi:hypothetical protein